MPVAVPGVPTDEYVGGLPIPYDDLQLVHEIRSITDPTGMAASTEKIYTMPSGRDYYRVIASLVENGTFNTSHITRTRWIYDGSTPTTDEYLAGFLHRNKLEKGRLPAEGTLWYDFSNRPEFLGSRRGNAVEIKRENSVNPEMGIPSGAGKVIDFPGTCRDYVRAPYAHAA